VRLLIDANLSPRIASSLRDEGHEAVHVADIGLLKASDESILAHAAVSRQVIISADTDFGELLAVSGASRPSVVLLRSADHLTPDQQATMLAANLPAVRRSVREHGDTKTRTSRRTLALPQHVVEVLHDHRERQLAERAECVDAWQDNDLVFCTHLGGGATTTSVLGS
jgi:predicted nuclease of predicted toxin-antitoxin system